jgi:ABC-type Fe3+ transport system permease subunit
MKHISYWWVFFWTQVVGIGVAGYYGFIDLMWSADITHLSIGICGMWLIGTIDVGRRTHQAINGKWSEPRLSWFLADAVTLVGMIGTLIGFIFMVGSSITDLDGVVNDDTLKTMLTSLTTGFGTAVWTTLIGLIASLSIKFQLNNLETMVDEVSNNCQDH